MSYIRDYLEVEVTWAIMESQGDNILKPRGTINKIARAVVDRLFQSDNLAYVQDYLDERVENELPT